MEVLPFQFEVIKRIRKKIKDKHYRLIFKYLDRYYYILFEDGIKQTFVEKSLEELFSRINEADRSNLYLDESLTLHNEENIKKINIGGILNEKIFAK